MRHNASIKSRQGAGCWCPVVVRAGNGYATNQRNIICETVSGRRAQAVATETAVLWYRSSPLGDSARLYIVISAGTSVRQQRLVCVCVRGRGGGG